MNALGSYLTEKAFIMQFIDPKKAGLRISVSSSKSGTCPRNMTLDNDLFWQSEEGQAHRIEVTASDFMKVSGFAIRFDVGYTPRELSAIDYNAYSERSATIMKFKPDVTDALQFFSFERMLRTKHIILNLFGSIHEDGCVMVHRFGLTDQDPQEYYNGASTHLVKEMATVVWKRDCENAAEFDIEMGDGTKTIEYVVDPIYTMKLRLEMENNRKVREENEPPKIVKRVVPEDRYHVPLIKCSRSTQTEYSLPDKSDRSCDLDPRGFVRKYWERQRDREILFIDVEPSKFSYGYRNFLFR